MVVGPLVAQLAPIRVVLDLGPHRLSASAAETHVPHDSTMDPGVVSSSWSVGYGRMSHGSQLGTFTMVKKGLVRPPKDVLYHGYIIS